MTGLPFSCADLLKIWESQTLVTLRIYRGITGIALPLSFKEYPITWVKEM
jgi:hypothetical protein